MLKSDLFFAEIVEDRLTQLQKVKNYIICAANGEIDKDDISSLEHLQNLVHLELELYNLKDNLPFIEFKPELS